MALKQKHRQHTSQTTEDETEIPTEPLVSTEEVDETLDEIDKVLEEQAEADLEREIARFAELHQTPYWDLTEAEKDEWDALYFRHYDELIKRGVLSKCSCG